MEQFDSLYFRGQGKLFFGDVSTSDQPENLLFIGDVTSANLSPSVQRGNVIENVTGAGAVAANWLKSTEYTFSANLRSVKPAHLAEALQSAIQAKVAGTVTDEPYTATHNTMIALKQTNVSAVVITDLAAVITYVEDTDYVVHATEGMIDILDTGSMTSGNKVLIDYSYAAQTHLKVAPADLTKSLVFAGLNSANNNKNVRCEIYKIKLDPSVLSFITDEATDMPISGVVQLASNRAAGDQLYSWKLED